MPKPVLDNISKELENINYKFIQNISVETSGKWEDVDLSENVNSEVKPTLLVVFQSSTKILFAIGKCIGLSPMTGVWDRKSDKMRLGIFIRKFLFAIVIGVFQTVGLILSVIYFKYSLNIKSIANLIFYLSTSASTFMYIYVGASKLPALLGELSKMAVPEYEDHALTYKSFAICIIVCTMALIEHILFYIAKVSKLYTYNLSSYDDFILKTYSWMFEIGLEGTTTMGILIQLTNLISTLNWNYSDMYIMCISIYLVSLLKHVNKKIVLASDKHYLTPRYWRVLREEYSRVTQLVHSFSDAISGIVLISFANTMFFICLQLYYIFLGVKTQPVVTKNNGEHTENKSTSYECSVYLGFSAAYLLARALAVSVLAASVHSASLVPATALYNVPPSSFSIEVERFLYQAHTDTVAISGLQFFYVTKELVLSLFGTVVTYELVMLQFGAQEIQYTDYVYC